MPDQAVDEDPGATEAQRDQALDVIGGSLDERDQKAGDAQQYDGAHHTGQDAGLQGGSPRPADDGVDALVHKRHFVAPSGCLTWMGAVQKALLLSLIFIILLMYKIVK